MSKRLLMLSTASVALFTCAALADTTLTSSDSKTTPYTTGAKASTDDTSTVENAGNFTVQSGGSLTISGLAQGAVTINSKNWVLNQGTINAKDKDATYAIRVNMSANPDLTGTSIGAVSGVSNTAIYLDSSSVTEATGSGKNKAGIYLDNTNCTSICTLTGSITVANGAQLLANGDSSAAMQIGTSTATTNYAVLKGTLAIGGTMSASAGTTGNNNKTSLGMYGLVSYGKIDGDVILHTGGTVSAFGEGATGMQIAGQGITGALQINGSLASSVLNDNNNCAYNYGANCKINTSTNAEAGSALKVLADVGKGISIGIDSSSTSATAGSITSAGNASLFGAAVQIGYGSQQAPVTVGVYTGDSIPGFSLYNRGTIAATYTNSNTPTVAMSLLGTGSVAATATTLSGGILNSGTITASATTTNDVSSSSGVYAYGLYVGDNVIVASNAAQKYDGTSATDPGYKASMVVTASGKIATTVSGTRGGTARDLWIASSTANFSSLINSGTISAAALTTNAGLSGGLSSNDPLAAVAIQDDSGTLTSIVNTGTISAIAGYSSALSTTSVSALDNNSQVAIAIQLGTTPNGATIKNYAGSTRAVILGDIKFGVGHGEVLDLQGNGAATTTDARCLQYTSCVIGNVTFGSNSSSDTATGNQLHIGAYSYLSGSVTAGTIDPNSIGKGAGVDVAIDAYGRLDLQNTSTVLDATSVTVQNNGTLNLGVNRSVTTSGMIAAQYVSFATGANLGVNYASFLPKNAQANGSYQFVLVTANRGQMLIGQDIIDKFNNGTDSYGNSTRPYLLKTAAMCNTNISTCSGFARPDSTKDYLLIDVTMKGAVDPNPNVADYATDKTVDQTTGVHTANYIGLTAGSVPVTPLMKSNCTVTSTNPCTTTLFEQTNLALAVDDELGSAFLNGITTAKQAAQAYNDMAPGVTGGTRAIAISITDSATGPVAARQRALRMYGKTSGDFTLWGQEFVQMIKDPGTGALDPNTGFKTSPGFKDHGFGIAVGIDGGSPKYGWYGGAITFYAGDVNELARNAHQNQQWYLLSLYSDWRGKGLFLDTKIDAGYGHIDGKRTLVLQRPLTYSTYWPNTSAVYLREADNKHAGALVSGSIATGAVLSYGAATFTPQFNLDAMFLREEGYTETNPSTTTVGDGFNLKVNQYYAKSLRAFVGLDTRYDFNLWDFYLQPEARVGYRYDFLSDPVKLKAAFAHTGISGNAVTSGDTFEVIGPDPSQGNFVLGASLAATTNTWTLGLNFDFVKGSNGAFQQVATVHLLGRI